MWPFKKKVKPLPPPGAMAAKVIHTLDTWPDQWVRNEPKGEIKNYHLGMTLYNVHLYVAWSLSDISDSFYYFSDTDSKHVMAAMKRWVRRQQDHKKATKDAQKYNDIAYAMAKLDKYQESNT